MLASLDSIVFPCFAHPDVATDLNPVGQIAKFILLEGCGDIKHHCYPMR